MSDSWRPPQWADSALTSITSSTVDEDGNRTTYTYVFDAVIRMDHHESVQPTVYPIQSGANMTDHAFNMPAELTMEIGMSDAMDRYSSDIFTSDSSKSVSAYQTLLDLKESRLPVAIITRLKTYGNMLIVDIYTPDDVRTRYGLKARVRFREIFTGTVATSTVSARSNATYTTPGGLVASHAPTNAVSNNNGVSATSSTPGAGTYSSTNSYMTSGGLVTNHAYTGSK